ncbi:porin (plasmid) [Cupriavidus pinatubonensis]|uniref:porin n=1 Tax=Cupriavidus pinatubonensis TaxID=248026 RepID=UPI001C73A374|nr:porin [Cupriavidus pinatubonensis]QYY33932.1 porin [Cupriavidus pinatubonensis]
MKLKYFATVSMLAGAGSAFAQTSVTLYGVVDANVEYVNHVGAVPTVANGFNPGSANKVFRMGSGGLSGSRWGIRGTEDLGSGLKSVFVLESGYAADTGVGQQSGRMFGRQAFVGLQSAGLGQLTFGRQYTSMFDALANFAPASYATLYEPTVLQNGGNYREDNTIKYAGQFGPLSAWAHWSFGVGLTQPQVAAGVPAVGGNGEVPGQFRRDSAYGAAAMYTVGPFAGTIGYDQWNPSIGTGNGSVKKASAAASYTVGLAKIMGGYRWGQSKNAADTEVLRDDYYWIGANYQATPALGLTLEYSYDNLKNVYGNTNAANPWQIAFVSTYAFSKRTDVYLTTAYSKNAGLTLESLATGYLTSLSLGSSYVLPSGGSSMLGVAVGLRHKF